MKVEDALKVYLLERLSLQRRGGSTGRSLTILFEPVAVRECRELTAETMADLLKRMALSAPVHAARARAYASPFLKWALARAIIDENPLARLPKTFPPAPRDRLLSLSEIRAIWSSAPVLGYPFGPAIGLLVLTAAHREEVASLKVSELSEGRGPGPVWRPGGRAGPEGSFDIPLAEPAILLIRNGLEKRQPGADLIFSVTGTTPISGWSRAKKRLDTLIGSPGVRSHIVGSWRLNDLRASFAAIAGEVLSIDPVAIERCLGRVSRLTDPIEREWVFSEPMLAAHRIALDRWAELVTSGQLPGGR